jgi:hypothetical protein
MFGQILYTQVKWTRAVLAVFSVMAFALPTFIWRVGRDMTWTDNTALQVIAGFGGLGPALGILAATIGFILVAVAWSADASARHVYPLSLPITWSRYAGMRFAAGALTLLVPAVALWLGALFVLASIDVPATLQAYPATLALRFFLGAVMAFALSFLLQYLMGRRAAITLGIVIISVLGTGAVMSLLGLDAVLSRVTALLTEWPGPLAIYAADWMLIDV